MIICDVCGNTEALSYERFKDRVYCCTYDCMVILSNIRLSHILKREYFKTEFLENIDLVKKMDQDLEDKIERTGKK